MSLPLLEKPPHHDLLDIFPPHIEQEARVGDVLFAYGAFGDPETFPENSTGFRRGYYFPPDFDVYSPEGQLLQLQYATELAVHLARSRGWDRIDLLTVGSMTMSDETAHAVAQELLSRYALPVNYDLYYHLACNSGLGAVMDVLREKQLLPDDLHVITIGLDALSGSRIDRGEDDVTHIMFGNGFSALAFMPKEIDHFGGRTLIVQDTEGVIMVPHVDGKCWTDPRISNPPGYTFHDGSDPIYRRTEHAVVLDIYRSPDGMFRMRPRATAGFFVTKSPKFFPQVLFDYQSTWDGHPLSPAITHLPSIQMLKGTFERTVENLLVLFGRSKQEAQLFTKCVTKEEKIILLDSYGLSRTIADIDMPWVNLDLNNVSAAMPLAQATKLAALGLIRPHTVVPVFGMGVGAILSVDFIRFCGQQ